MTSLRVCNASVLSGRKISRVTVKQPLHNITRGSAFNTDSRVRDGGTGAGGRVPPGAFTWKIFLTYREKRDKEKKGGKWRRKKGRWKIWNGRGKGMKLSYMKLSRRLFFFFCLSLFETTEICLGSTKMEISTRKKHFTLGKNRENLLCPHPPKKNIPLTPLCTDDLFSPKDETPMLLDISYWCMVMSYRNISYVSLFNSSQLAKMKKEYSWHVPAIKFIGMKQLV